MVIEKDITMAEAAWLLGWGKEKMLKALRAGLIPTAYQSHPDVCWYISSSSLEQFTREGAHR